MGLKENVITGRLIPAGRGLLSEGQEDELISKFDIGNAMKEIENEYVSSFDFKEREKEEIFSEHQENSQTSEEKQASDSENK